MNQEIFAALRDYINNNEAGAWEECLDLRREFEENHREFLSELQIESREEAIGRGYGVVSRALESFKNVLDLSKMDPGHGIGHVGVDFLHTMALAQNLDIDPKQLYIGFVGAVLHDILGCSLVPRYEEGKRAVRHAEAGGLLLMVLSQEIGISRKEAILIYYAIAAHTHYLKPSIVKCSDGIERDIQPYVDMLDGQPMMNVWLSRWVDRLDVNGPRLVGRHFLTLSEQYQGFSSSNGFYTVEFSTHMRPLLRSIDEIKADPHGMTMREHLNMFASSQNNDSPYGYVDAGFMVTTREAYKERLFRIIDAFNHPLQLSLEAESALLDEWTQWLSEKVEPSESGRCSAQKLQEMFLALPRDIRESWYGAMRVTMDEYREWAEGMHALIEQFPTENLMLPILGDVRKIV